MEGRIVFSREEKQQIAKAVEDVIREIDHPEMDNENIRFQLHVDGKESWSYADITDNRRAGDGANGNPWNETARAVLERGA